MFDIQKLRNIKAQIICIGSHGPIIQSMFDFDFLSGKTEPSVLAVIAPGRKYERFFFGKKEVAIPVFDSIEKVPTSIKNSVNLFFNTNSARRVKQSSIETLKDFPHILGGTIFAEDVPEKHAIELIDFVNNSQTLTFSSQFIIGPASVGLIIPGSFKIGAIGGTDYRQLIASDVMNPGSVAVLSASGGMVGEIIRIVAQAGKLLSFSLSFGGDRFPILSPKDAFLSAEKDPHTTTIVYYGELGGSDEYELAELLEKKQVTKEVICYVAGTVSELFDTPPQFGHAKAMAKNKTESAREKRDALRKAGAKAPETFAEFVKLINNIPSSEKEKKDYNISMQILSERKKALITSSISSDVSGDASIMGKNLLEFVNENSFPAIVAKMFLGKKSISKELESFFDVVLRMLVDHGPYVSGAMNTIVTARAGRDLVSSLSSGLLTIGPRFGGAINQAAVNWLSGVIENKPAYDFVEEFASKKVYIQGIGHKKYRIDFPDPRVKEILQHAEKLQNKRFTNFALEVQKITTAKKGNLILNVDGSIGAVLLDILSEKEGMTDDELKQLTNIEFFNALFVLSRSVGFISHFLDQKRLDEGLLRLPVDLVTYIEK